MSQTLYFQIPMLVQSCVLFHLVFWYLSNFKFSSDSKGVQKLIYSPTAPPKYIYFTEYAKPDLKCAAYVYENENQMSIDNSIADADTLLNENSCSVAEEAEILMYLIWMSFTFLSGNSV